MRYYVKVSYYDDSPDMDTFDTADEAGDCFRATVDCVQANGRQAGDVAQVSTGIVSQDGKLSIRGAVHFA